DSREPVRIDEGLAAGRVQRDDVETRELGDRVHPRDVLHVTGRKPRVEDVHARTEGPHAACEAAADATVSDHADTPAVDAHAADRRPVTTPECRVAAGDPAQAEQSE